MLRCRAALFHAPCYGLSIEIGFTHLNGGVYVAVGCDGERKGDSHERIYGYLRCVSFASIRFAGQRILSCLPESDETAAVRKRPGKSVRKCKGLVILGDAPHNRPVYALQHLNIHNGVGVGRFGQAKGKFANRYDFDLLGNGHGFARAILRGGGERVRSRLTKRNAAAVCVERTLIGSTCLYAEKTALGQAPVYGSHVF